MDSYTILAGIITILLLIYLFISLVKPEWFG